MYKEMLEEFEKLASECSFEELEVLAQEILNGVEDDFDIDTEIKRLEGINFRDDRLSIADFVNTSSENIGKEHKKRIVKALRSQEKVLGEVGSKRAFESLEDLESFEKYHNVSPEEAKKQKDKFMNTHIAYNHPAFGTVSQPRYSYNKWYREKDPDALFENVSYMNGKPLKALNKNRTFSDKLLGKNKHVPADMNVLRDNFKKHITSTYPREAQLYTAGTFLDYGKWYDTVADTKKARELLYQFEKLASECSFEELEVFAAEILQEMEKASSVELGFLAFKEKEDIVKKMTDIKTLKDKYPDLDSYDWPSKEDRDTYHDKVFEVLEGGKEDYQYNDKVNNKHLAHITNNTDIDPFIYSDKDGIKGKLPVSMDDAYGIPSVVTSEEGPISLIEHINEEAVPKLRKDISELDKQLLDYKSNMDNTKIKIQDINRDNETLKPYNIISKLRNKAALGYSTAKLKGLDKEYGSTALSKDERVEDVGQLNEWTKAMDLALKDNNKLYNFYYY